MVTVREPFIERHDDNAPADSAQTLGSFEGIKHGVVVARAGQHHVTAFGKVAVGRQCASSGVNTGLGPAADEYVLVSTRQRNEGSKAVYSRGTVAEDDPVRVEGGEKGTVRDGVERLTRCGGGCGIGENLQARRQPRGELPNVEAVFTKASGYLSQGDSGTEGGGVASQHAVIGIHRDHRVVPLGSQDGTEAGDRCRLPRVAVRADDRDKMGTPRRNRLADSRAEITDIMSRGCLPDLPPPPSCCRHCTSRRSHTALAQFAFASVSSRWGSLGHPVLAGPAG
ncbi:hypothetical protein [Streptomyces viridochromogenes]|uniref:hypothetical protein n=1 Tax=Streptomyces viridochromogenes TaxID=1938 RepID=UPI00131E2195|nr:hypothetical protein [Streptomyces viridochromogenes]